jgi:hypothetical protein
MLARLLLVLALLAGWQAALVHPLEHVDEHGHLVHAGDGRGHDGNASSDPSAKLCDALSALTACAAQAGFAVEALAAEQQFFGFIAGRLRRADPPPFLAQGPPALL